MRNKIIETVEREKIIVIVRGVEKSKLIPFAEAVYQGGIRLLEITYDAKEITAPEETAENIEMLARHFAGRMFIGAGTVINEKQAELTQKAGGGFIISPDTCSEVILKTLKLGMVSIPGAVTPSEIQQAHRLGADFVKLFPAVHLGPEYIKAITAPLSHIKLLAVGGVTEKNVQEYLSQGVCGFGIGANIVDKTMIANGDFAGITELAKKYTAAVRRR